MTWMDRLSLRRPNVFAQDVGLETYVREELLGEGLVPEPWEILRAHRALQEVLRDVRVPYLVRKQGTQGPWSLRGKETDIGIGRSAVFTDNSPAVWLNHQLLMLPGRERARDLDLARSLRQREVPAARQLGPAERAQHPEWPLLAQSVGRRIPLAWSGGWKVSHILPCSPQSARGDDPLAAETQLLQRCLALLEPRSPATE
jgi:hypothetical protein